MSQTTKRASKKAASGGRKTLTIKKELTNTVIFLSVIIIVTLATILVSLSNVSKASITNITNSITSINEIQSHLSRGIENINKNLQTMTENSATVVSAAESMKNQSSDLSSTVDSFNV